MLSPLQSWGRWVRSGGPPVPLILDRPPPKMEFPARALTTPHPNPPSSLISPIFRISTKADVAKSASSSYNKIQSFMHCRKYTAVIKSHGKYDSWHTFQEVWPQGAEAVSFKSHLKHISWRNFVRENGF